MMEQWTRWEPISGLEGRYTLDSFLWLDKGFLIELINWKQEKKIQILFDEYVDAYRYTNETFYLTVLDNASPKPDTGFYENYSLFKITNSDYLAWILEKSCTLSERMLFTHFCIIGGDEIIDVIANYEPKVTIMEYKPEVKIYSKKEFGLELKEKIKNKEDVARIARWAFSVYRDNFYNIDADFKNLLNDLSIMEDSPGFVKSYEDLDRMADRLIAGKDAKLYS